MHNTRCPRSLVSSSHTLTTLFSCPRRRKDSPGHNCNRRPKTCSAVSSQRASSHSWWWSEQSKAQRRPPEEAPDVICTALHSTRLDRHSRLGRTLPSSPKVWLRNRTTYLTSRTTSTCPPHGRVVFYYSTNCRQPFPVLFALGSSRDVTEALVIVHGRENADNSVPLVTLHCISGRRRP